METTMDKTQTQTATPTEPKKLMSFREFLKSNYVPTKPKGPKKK
jgi:carbohydrate-binding DOMON domain-containing protein